jgi:hypothetical protein
MTNAPAHEPAIEHLDVKRITRHGARQRIVTAACTCGVQFIEMPLPARTGHKRVAEIVVEAYVHHLAVCRSRS